MPCGRPRASSRSARPCRSGSSRNDEIALRIDTSDEWIRARTGIAERRVAAPDVWASDLGLAAAQQALDRSGLAPADIDIVIAATCSPDAYFPSIAAVIADGLGAHSAAANDISAACTGWVYALMNAVTQIQSGLAQHVLVVGAETLSKILDWDDRSTCILFGDGAGACVMSAGALPETVFGLELGADGSRGNDLDRRRAARQPRDRDGRRRGVPVRDDGDGRVDAARAGRVRRRHRRGRLDRAAPGERPDHRQCRETSRRRPVARARQPGALREHLCRLDSAVPRGSVERRAPEEGRSRADGRLRWRSDVGLVPDRVGGRRSRGGVCG